MDEKDLTGKTCGILDEETRRKMQADADAEHNRIIEIGGMRFGEGLSDLGREREQALRNQDKSKTIEIKPDVVTLEEARQIFTFTFGVPIWLPDGFTIDDKIRISGMFHAHRQLHGHTRKNAILV
jgi:hypothetical protein